MDLDKINLEGLTDEQIKFAVFKNIFESQNEEDLSLSERYDKMFEDESDNSQNKKILSTMLLADILKTIRKDFEENRTTASDILEEYYPHILRSMKQLSKELNLKNSLELSNLYSYLLWNGYLSKLKKNVYRIEKRKLIEGLYFADIMDGAAVCLNHADMLKDFLNTCGYNSSLIVNLVDNKKEINYKLDIERKSKESTLGTKIMTTALTPLIKKVGNHAFNLIEDNGKLYIYDSTNFLLLSVEDPYTAKLINGTGTFKLHPCFSYIFSNSEEQKCPIEKLFAVTDFSSPYSRKDCIFTGEKNIELFSDNQRLIEDFYDEVRLDFVNISEATDRIKTKQKTR